MTGNRFTCKRQLKGAVAEVSREKQKTQRREQT